MDLDVQSGLSRCDSDVRMLSSSVRSLSMNWEAAQ